jgi:hypothetical protein
MDVDVRRMAGFALIEIRLDLSLMRIGELEGYASTRSIVVLDGCEIES